MKNQWQCKSIKKNAIHFCLCQHSNRFFNLVYNKYLLFYNKSSFVFKKNYKQNLKLLLMSWYKEKCSAFSYLFIYRVDYKKHFGLFPICYGIEMKFLSWMFSKIMIIKYKTQNNKIKSTKVELKIKMKINIELETEKFQYFLENLVHILN